MTYNKLETEAKHSKQYDKNSDKANSTGSTSVKYFMKGLRQRKRQIKIADMKVIQDDMADFEPKNIYNVTTNEF